MSSIDNCFHDFRVVLGDRSQYKKRRRILRFIEKREAIFDRTDNRRIGPRIHPHRRIGKKLQMRQVPILDIDREDVGMLVRRM